MDSTEVWKRVILWAIGILVVVAIAGGLYFYYIWPSMNPNEGTQQNPTVIPPGASSTLQTSQAVQRAVELERQNQASSSAQITATQNAVQQASKQQSSNPTQSQAELTATQKAVEAAVKAQQQN